MRKLLLITTFLTVCGTASAQYDPTWSGMINQNSRDIETGQRCIIQHDPQACAQMKRDIPRIQQQTRQLEDYNQFEEGKNQSDRITHGVTESNQQLLYENTYHDAIMQRDSWENAAQAARAQGDFQGAYEAHQQALGWDQQATTYRPR